MAVASLGVIGTGFATGAATIDVPVTVNVPRSDPAAGASVVIVLPFMTDGTVVSSVRDDAATDSFYSTHLYTDGLNPPYVRRSGPGSLGWNALILNPLTAGTDTITLQLAGSTTFGGVLALGYTGVQVDNQSNPTYQVPDQPTLNWFDFLHIPSPFGLYGGNPFSAGSGNTRYLQWGFDPVAILNPSTASYPNWSIQAGELGLYFVFSSSFSTTAPGDFSPSDGAWAEAGALVDQATPPGSFFPAQTMSVWEKPVSAPELNGDLGGTFASASTDFGAIASGVSLIAGLGPIWADVPPPPVAAPYFNDVMIRAA